MGSKTRLISYCTKRGDNTVNLVTSRKTIAKLVRPIAIQKMYPFTRIFIVQYNKAYHNPDRNPDCYPDSNLDNSCSV